MQCPKCTYVRQPEDTSSEGECPRCGIIYAKFRPRENLPSMQAIAPSPSSNPELAQNPNKFQQAATIFGVAVFLAMLFPLADSLPKLRFFSIIYALLSSLPGVGSKHVAVLLMFIPAVALLRYTRVLARLSDRSGRLFVVLGVSSFLYVAWPWVLGLMWGWRWLYYLDDALRLSILFALVGILINMHPFDDAADAEEA